MLKYFEAGLISFIFCLVFAAVMAMGKQQDATTMGLRPSPQPQTPVPESIKPSPIIPRFKLATDLPSLTPQETRTQNSVSVASNQTFDQSVSEDWQTEWQSSWDEMSSTVDPESKQYRIEIDPSNYGDRVARDIHGKQVQNPILVVLHETTASAESAIYTFQTRHVNDADQVSYHALILLDGRIIHLVPPEKRAYGAGNSEFRGKYGVETVQTNPKYPASVNNFAYHISLETPVEAQNKDVESHSGYTFEQYNSLAWLVRQLQVDRDRVTTHQAIDRSQDRSDPRSFDMQYFDSLLF